MLDALGQTLGYAVGIAISPIPIAAVILMLFSSRARVNSVSFMVAWLVGIALVTTVMVMLPGLDTEGSEPSTTTGWIKLAIGLLLLTGGARQWHSRPGPDEEPSMPGWMGRIDDLGPTGAFGLGFVLSAVNPKNLLLAAAAGASIGALGLSGGEATGAVGVFTLIAGISVMVPVVAYLVSGHRLDDTLDAAKAWLISNNAAVMAVLFVVFAAKLIGDAISILT